MKLKDGFILREVAGEYVVVPSGDDVNLNMLITLNDTGCTLWKKLEEGAEKSDLVSALMAEYKVDEDTASRHVDTFVENLKKHDFRA